MCPSPLRAALAGLVVAVVTACAPTVQQAPAPGADAVATGADYQLAAGDRLKIGTFGHPDFSGEFQVDGEGYIAFPLLGAVAADGRTADELRQDLALALNANYIVDPQVSVEVLTFRPLFVLGQVNRPNSFAYRPGMTVRQAVAMAGGFTRRAKTGSMTLIRDTKLGAQTYRATPDTPLLPGDTIEVGRRLF